MKAPAFTSPSAKGLIPPAEPWFAGTFMNGNVEAAILAECDLVLAIGLDANDFFNSPWSYQATVIALEPEVANPQHFLPAKAQIVGDVSAIVEDMLAAAFEPNSQWQPSDVSDYLATFDQLFRTGDDRLTIPTALAEARAALPADAIVAADAGFGKPILSYLWPLARPNSFFASHGLSTMGYAIPAANALKLAYPERPVVAFMGDGSLLQRAGEIGVAAEQGIAPIYVAWVDASLSQIEIKQRRQQLRPVGVSFSMPCCAKIAEAFGGAGWDVETRADFRDALCEALGRREPCLIGAKIDQTAKDEWFDLIRG